MAIFESTAFTRLRKSFGNLTTCFSRGQNIVRNKVTQVRNPRTPKQLHQRKIWSVLATLCEPFAEAIYLGFPERPVKETPNNAFMKANAEAIEVDEQLEATINYEKLVCSRGSISTANVTATLNAGEKQLTFTHEPQTYGKRAEADDQLYAAVYEKDRQQLLLCKLGTRSSTTPATVSLPDRWNPAALEVYTFVVTANGQRASATEYLTVQP